MKPKLIKNKPLFPFSVEQQKMLYQAGFKIVFCDTEKRQVLVCNGQSVDIIQQDTRESTRQRAKVFLSPQFLVFLDDALLPDSLDQLNRSGFICFEDTLNTITKGRQVYILTKRKINLS